MPSLEYDDALSERRAGSSMNDSDIAMHCA